MENAREARDTNVAEGEKKIERWERVRESERERANSRISAGTRPNSIKFKVRLPGCIVTE